RSITQHGEVEHQRVRLQFRYPGRRVFAAEPGEVVQLEGPVEAMELAHRQVEQVLVEGSSAGDDVDLLRAGYQRSAERDGLLDVERHRYSGRSRRPAPAIERAVEDAVEEDRRAGPDRIAVPRRE